MKELSDAALMELSAKGSEIAFAEIVQRYQDILLNFFLRSCVSYVDGQDLAQRTFLRLWRYRRKYTAEGAKFTTFLFMLARQESIDFFAQYGIIGSGTSASEVLTGKAADSILSSFSAAVSVPYKSDKSLADKPLTRGELAEIIMAYTLPLIEE